MAFAKVDCGILDSSLWVERDQRSLFLTALFMAKPFEITEPVEVLKVDSLEPDGWSVPPGWYGLIAAAGPAIVHRDGVDKDIGMAALNALCMPDHDSRSPGFEGRRLARIKGGYLMLNYMQYRDMDHGAADRMRRLRARRKTAAGTAAVEENGDGSHGDVTDRNGVTQRNNVTVTGNVTQADSREQKAEAVQSVSQSGDDVESTQWSAIGGRLPPADRGAFLTLLRWSPNPNAWAAEIGAVMDGMHGVAVAPDRMGEAVRDFVAQLKPGVEPSLRHFRAYIQRSRRPVAESISPKTNQGGARNDDAIDRWVKDQEDGDAGSPVG